MDKLPMEVVGNILSHLGAARDVIIASATCRKWREATLNHLRTLCFNTSDWPGYRDHSAEELEVIITQTILQTKSLNDLSIDLGHTVSFSAAPIIAWLLYTRESLRFLNWKVPTKTSVNVLERCGKQRLEQLVVGFTTISSFDPTIQKFPVLQSLTLLRVHISASDLKHLVSACPRLESLSLKHAEVLHSGLQSSLELCSPSLKEFFADVLSIDHVVLNADSLESLILMQCRFEEFELVCSGSLRVLRIDLVSAGHLEVANSIALLDDVDVKDFTIASPFYEVLSKASKLRSLRLWGILINEEEEIMGLETIAVSFPRLRHLALNYGLVDGALLPARCGATLLENVVWLELGSTVINEPFAQCIGGVLERIPHLKRLVVHGHISEAIARDDTQMIARFTTCLVQLIRRFSDVELDLDYR